MRTLWKLIGPDRQDLPETVFRTGEELPGDVSGARMAQANVAMAKAKALRDRLRAERA